MATTITTQDWADLLAGRTELRERPAEPGDVRFEITRNPEPDDTSNLYLVVVIDDHGEVIDSHMSEDGYSEVEAFRERQAIPDLEERLEFYAEREARDRMYGRGGW